MMKDFLKKKLPLLLIGVLIGWSLTYCNEELKMRYYVKYIYKLEALGNYNVSFEKADTAGLYKAGYIFHKIHPHYSMMDSIYYYQLWHTSYMHPPK